MKQFSVDESEVAVGLTVALTDALESCGVPRTEYRLYESVDVDALARLVETDDVEAQITVEGVPLQVTADGVTVLQDEPTTTPTA